MNDTTRRYPRTIQEACGAHATSYISEPKRPIDAGDKAVLWACLALSIIGIVWGLA